MGDRAWIDLGMAQFFLQTEERNTLWQGRPRAYGSDLPIGAIWEANEEQRGRAGIVTLMAGGSASAAPGDEVHLKGTPEPFAPFGATRAWRSVLPVLANHTYTMADPEGDIVAMLTSDQPAPEGVDPVPEAVDPPPEGVHAGAEVGEAPQQGRGQPADGAQDHVAAGRRRAAIRARVRLAGVRGRADRRGGVRPSRRPGSRCVCSSTTYP